MSPRYSNSIKIGKGVKVNLGKTGPSLSLKVPGASVNVSKRGVKVSTPTSSKGGHRPPNPYGGHTPPKPPAPHGSYNSYYGNSYGSSYKRPSGHNTVTFEMPISFTVQMNEKGKTWVVDDRGYEITDAATLRRIKADPGYLRQKAQLEAQRQTDIANTIEASIEETEKFLNIYKFSPVVESEKDFLKELKNLKPETFHRSAFTVPEPDVTSIRLELEKEAMEQINGFFLTVNKRREEYVTLNLPVRLEKARQEWMEKKYVFEAEQAEQEREFNANVQQEYESKKAYLDLMIQGDSELLPEAIDNWISQCQLPVEIAISYSWEEMTGTLYVDVDLPEIEALPQTEMTRMENGNLKEKNKTQKQLRDEYATVVFGMAVFITSNLFNISPAIRRILISGYTQKRDKVGDIVDYYLYSIKFFREMFEGQNLTGKDPMGVCMAAENRCNTTSTFLFKAIEPFDQFQRIISKNSPVLYR